MLVQSSSLHWILFSLSCSAFQETSCESQSLDLEVNKGKVELVPRASFTWPQVYHKSKQVFWGTAFPASILRLDPGSSSPHLLQQLPPQSSSVNLLCGPTGTRLGCPKDAKKIPPKLRKSFQVALLSAVPLAKLQSNQMSRFSN